MGFVSQSRYVSFLAKPIVGTIGSIATGLLGQKGANDRNEQQIAMTREQMEIGRASCRERVYVLV